MPAASVPEAEKLLASMAAKTEKLAELISNGRVSDETTEVRRAPPGTSPPGTHPKGTPLGTSPPGTPPCTPPGTPPGTEGCSLRACTQLRLHAYGYGCSLLHLW